MEHIQQPRRKASSRRNIRHELDTGHQLYQKLANRLLRRVSLNYQDFKNDPSGVLEALSIASTSRMKRGDVEGYRLYASVSAFLSKYEAHEPAICSHFDPRRTAEEKWAESEQSCLRFNERVRRLPIVDDPKLRSLLFKLRSEIEGLIGYYPDMDKIRRSCYWSPGASIGVHGDSTSIGVKLFADKMTVTQSAAHHFLASLIASGYTAEGPLYTRLDYPSVRSYSKRLEIVLGNKISFVAKTVKTERPIAVEPLGNGFCQSGIDSVLRQHLLKWGIDLTDQVRNQVLSSVGSVKDLATIDLSSASDSISLELVRRILPPPWFELLDDCRSKETSGVKLEKFCSMGNNFCFPLQTLIFAAICRISGSAIYSVYGDDIVCSGQSSWTVLDILQELGFSPNVEKTFLYGNFRESCGTDWLCGQNVRPAYAKKAWTRADRVMDFHNVALERWPSSLQDLLVWLRGHVPLTQRFVSPPFGGDPSGTFRVELDEFMASPHTSWNKHLFAWKWKRFMASPLYTRHEATDHPWFQMFLACNGQDHLNGLPLRRKTRTRIVYTYGTG